MLGLVAGAFFVLNNPGYSGVLGLNGQALGIFSVAISGLISLSWFLYLRRLDHFRA